MLERTGILAFLDDESRQHLASYGREMAVEPGQTLIHEGEINASLYIVAAGTYEITTQVSGRPVHLDSMGPGDCFGEIAIFHPNNASATVASREAGRLWSIDAAHLQEFLLDYPCEGCAVILGINVILSRRLKRANEVIRRSEIVPVFLAVRAQKHRN